MSALSEADRALVAAREMIGPRLQRFNGWLHEQGHQSGFRMGVGRQPLSPEQKTDLSTLSKTLQCLLAEHGFTNEPVGGCPAGTGANGFDPRQVNAIVQTVVDELRRRTKGLPVTGFLCHNRVCGMPDELSERHIELLATVVRPALMGE